MNKPQGFNYNGDRWYFDPATGWFIGPNQTVKPYHPLYCRLQAAMNEVNSNPPVPATLKLGCL